MTNTNDIEKNDKHHRNVNSSNGHIEIRGNYNDQLGDIDKEDILDVMGCKTRRDIINLLREEPMFVSEISNELDIGQKAIIEHLRAMEDIGILNSSYKKILRGRPRKYYDLQHEVNIHITINKNTFDVNLSEDMLNTLQLPSGDEWSKLLDIEKRIDNGQLEAIDELKNQIRLYDNLFTKENLNELEEGDSYLNYLNPESLTVLKDCMLEKLAEDAKPGERFQFVRNGYFVKDTKDENVFIRIVSLKDSFKI